MSTFFKNLALVTTVLCTNWIYASDSFKPLISKGEFPAELRAFEILNNKSDAAGVEFYNTYTYELNLLVRNNYVLYGDKLSSYVNSIHSKIYKENVDLKVETKIFVIKNTTVNAFAYPNGYIFLTTGLIAQCETEAHLAFIICHEIQHVVANHGWLSFKEKNDILKGNGDYANIPANQRINLALKHSRAHEFYADKSGLNLYKNLALDAAQPMNVMKMLHHSEHPYENTIFDFSIFEDSSYQFPDFYKLTDSIGFESKKDDDKQSTHPSTEKRISSLRGLTQKNNKGEFYYYGANKSIGKTELIKDSPFKDIQEICRFENIYLHINNNRYVRALYESYLAKSLYQDDLFIEKVQTYILCNLAKAANTEAIKKSNFMESTEELGGNQKALLFFLKKLSQREIFILAKHKLLANKRRFSDPFFDVLNMNLNRGLVEEWEQIYTEIKDSFGRVNASYYLDVFQFLDPSEGEVNWLSLKYDIDSLPQLENTKTIYLSPIDVVRVRVSRKGAERNGLKDYKYSIKLSNKVKAIYQDLGYQIVDLDPVTQDLSTQDYNDYQYLNLLNSKSKQLQSGIELFDMVDSNFNHRVDSLSTNMLDVKILAVKVPRTFNYEHLVLGFYIPPLIPYYIVRYAVKPRVTNLKVHFFSSKHKGGRRTYEQFFRGNASTDYILSYIYSYETENK